VIDEHAAAVLALLDADNTAPALVVYDGRVPSGIDPKATPYVLAYFSGGWPDLTFTSITLTFQLRITLHCVGGNAQAARMVSDRGRAALLDVRPTIAGRSCYPIRWDLSLPPGRDETTGSMVMDQVDEYVLSSIPG
jgi:hypothetical protein